MARRETSAASAALVHFGWLGGAPDFFSAAAARCGTGWRRRNSAAQGVYSTDIRAYTHLVIAKIRGMLIMNYIEIAHFQYCGSIEYRDTRDGIVIVAPISGIAQHYGDND